MNFKLTTALSVVGVLSAGTAAAAVNTTILDRPSSEPAAFAEVLPTTLAVSTPAPETTPATPSTTIDIEVVTVTTPAPPTTAASPYLTTFNVGQAGKVTVDVVDGVLQIIELSVADGWDGSQSDTGDPATVEANFASGSLRVRFSAVFADGTIVPTVNSSSTDTGASGGSGSSGNSGGSGGGQQPAPAPAPAPEASGSGNGGGSNYEDDDDHEEPEYEDDDDYEEPEYEDDDGDDEGHDSDDHDDEEDDRDD